LRRAGAICEMKERVAQRSSKPPRHKPRGIRKTFIPLRVGVPLVDAGGPYGAGQYRTMVAGPRVPTFDDRVGVVRN